MAQKVLDNMVKLHGPPLVIISERNTVFVSHFWKELLKVIGVQAKLSTTYHLWVNRKSEPMLGNVPQVPHWSSQNYGIILSIIRLWECPLLKHYITWIHLH